MQIPLSRFLAKFILWVNPFSRFKIMCLGYADDYEQFTELVWQDDCDLDFKDHITYPRFELWYV